MLPKPMEKRALVVEGGGMKAAYASGVLTAFEHAGYYPWDLVVGTSAGGAMAAWYSAGQAEFAEGTFPYAEDPRIMSYRRWLTGRGPLLDHEALMTVIYQDEHPLDITALRKARWPVIVNAVDAETGEVHYHDIRKGDTMAWLKATGRLPMASGPPVIIDGRPMLDGGTVDPIPIGYAFDQGASHVTLITNKPIGFRKPDPRPIVAIASRQYPAIREGMQQHQARKWQGVQAALHPPEGRSADVIAPSKPTRITRLGRNREDIDEAIALGRHDGRAFLQQQDL